MIPNDFHGELEKLPDGDFLVVGLGNEMRGDDKAGVLVAEKGAKEFPGNFINAGMSIENYIFKITSRPEKNIIIADAADFGGSTGEIRVIPSENLAEQGISTHSLSLKRISVFFDDAGQKVFFLAIQPKNTAVGEAASDEVRKSAEYILDFFREKLSVKCTN